MLPQTGRMLLIFTLVVFVQSSLALQCWDCASNMNPLCGDPMNTTEHQATFHTKVCGGGGLYESSRYICRKIVKRENGERVVIRQCSTPNVDETDIFDGACSAMAVSGRSVIESCHICSTDLCNSATSSSVMKPLFVVAFICCLFQSKYNII